MLVDNTTSTTPDGAGDSFNEMLFIIPNTTETNSTTPLVNTTISPDVYSSSFFENFDPFTLIVCFSFCVVVTVIINCFFYYRKSSSYYAGSAQREAESQSKNENSYINFSDSQKIKAPFFNDNSNTYSGSSAPIQSEYIRLNQCHPGPEQKVNSVDVDCIYDDIGHATNNETGKPHAAERRIISEEIYDDISHATSGPRSYFIASAQTPSTEDLYDDIVNLRQSGNAPQTDDRLTMYEPTSEENIYQN